MPENDNWQPVHEVARRLREKAVSAMNNGMFEIAETYDAQATNLLILDWLDQQGRDE